MRFNALKVNMRILYCILFICGAFSFLISVKVWKDPEHKSHQKKKKAKFLCFAGSVKI
jgi:uncharacterized membrane protein YuzA (DUF378 family)